MSQTITGESFDPLRMLRGIAASLLSGGLAVVAWIAWLPWDAARQVSPSGSETGPYSSGQVIALMVTVGVIAMVGGWLELVLPSALGLAVGLTLIFSVWAANQPDDGDANIWPVGAVMLFGAAAVGLFVVAYVFRWVHDLARNHRYLAHRSN